MSKQIVMKIRKPRKTPNAITANHANRTLFCGRKTLLGLFDEHIT